MTTARLEIQPKDSAKERQRRRSVIVVGAGPVGLVSALALQRQGFQVTVLEAAAQLEGVSHADKLQPAALDLLDELGVLDDLRVASEKISLFQFRELDGTVVAAFDLALIEGETKHAFQLCCPQKWIVQILSEHLQMRSLPINFSSSVRRLEQRGGRVHLSIDHCGHLEAIDADYLIAADGARSSMRTALHIPFVGPTRSNRVIEIMTTFELERVLPSLASSAHVMDATFPFSVTQVLGPWRVLLPVPANIVGSELFRSRWHMECLQKVFAVDPHIPVFHETVYDVRSGMAERFRLGNVFLVGDAAHVGLPFASMGLSSGIVDACTVADALAFRESSGLDLLDGWAEERKVAAVHAIDEGNQLFADLCAPAADRAGRNERLQRLAADSADTRAYLRRVGLLETTASAWSENAVEPAT